MTDHDWSGLPQAPRTDHELLEAIHQQTRRLFLLHAVTLGFAVLTVLIWVFVVIIAAEAS